MGTTNDEFSSSSQEDKMELVQVITRTGIVKKPALRLTLSLRELGESGGGSRTRTYSIPSSPGDLDLLLDRLEATIESYYKEREE